MNLEKIKKAYVIGIKGSGVIAVVEFLHVMGIEITGSDTEEKFFTDEILQKLNISYFEKFEAKNIPLDVDLVVYSTAYNENNNVEFQEAKKRNLEMISYPEILAQLFNEKYGIAVCGTHGKTTTSAMLAYVLKEIGTDPNAIIGSKVIDWGGNALIGKGEFFVAETDEFQNKLRLYNPKAVILTNLDFDHPDTFPTFQEYKQAFSDFVARIPKIGFLVVWGDSVDTLEVTQKAICEKLVYGFSDECDYKIFNFQFFPSSRDPAKAVAIFNQFPISNDKILKPMQKFEVLYKDNSLGEFEIKLIGKHNVLNAVAVIAVCHKLNLDLEKVKEVLKNFQGTKRRFEYIGERNGAILIDDYGHHPEELKVTLKGAREIYPEKNIWAVFHPHSYSRTEALLQEFSQSFSDADRVIVLDIYGSARENNGKVNSGDLVKLINKFDRDKAQYLKTIDEAVEFLQDKIGADDVVITIGAGNGWEVAEKLKEK